MAHTQHHPVLVVGAGPTGLTTAIELARHGIVPRVIDRRDEPLSTPRALGLQARALEIGDTLGVSDEWLRLGNWCEGFALYADGKRQSELRHDLARFGSRREGTLFLHQSETERVLRERFQALGGTIEWSTPFESAEQHEDGFDAIVGGDHVRVDWLVGADGASSAVRDALGITFPGHEDETWLVCDGPWDVPLTRDRVHMCRTPGGNVVLFPYGPGERWSAVDTEPPDKEPETESERTALARTLEDRVHTATGVRIGIERLEWVSRFTIPQRHASAMREGRGFLAGDAVHVHSPASGRGMNAGIEDAHNLGWRLAAVLRGEADPAILDGYERERDPAASRLLGMSWLGTRLIEERPTPVHRAFGALIALQQKIGPLHRWVSRLYTGEMSGLGLDYEAGERFPKLDPSDWQREDVRSLLDWMREPGMKLLAGPHAAPVPATGFPLRVAEPALARLLGVEDRVVVLRPDGRSVGISDPRAEDTAETLRSFGLRVDAGRYDGSQNNVIPRLDRPAA